MPGMIRRNTMLGALAMSVVALTGSVAVEGLKLNMHKAPAAAAEPSDGELVRIMSVYGVDIDTAKILWEELKSAGRSAPVAAAATAAGPSDEELDRISEMQGVDRSTARAIWEALGGSSSAPVAGPTDEELAGIMAQWVDVDEETAKAIWASGNDVQDQQHLMESIVPDEATPYHNKANVMHMKDMQRIENQIRANAVNSFPGEDDASARMKINRRDELSIQSAIEKSKFESALLQFKEAGDRIRVLRQEAGRLGEVQHLSEDDQIALAIAESEKEQLLKELHSKDEAQRAAAAVDQGEILLARLPELMQEMKASVAEEEQLLQQYQGPEQARILVALYDVFGKQVEMDLEFRNELTPVCDEVSRIFDHEKHEQIEQMWREIENSQYGNHIRLKGLIYSENLTFDENREKFLDLGKGDRVTRVLRLLSNAVGGAELSIFQLADYSDEAAEDRVYLWKIVDFYAAMKSRPAAASASLAFSAPPPVPFPADGSDVEGLSAVEAC